MDTPVKIPEFSQVDEKLNTIRQLARQDPLLPIIKEKFQTEITHHLTSLKAQSEFPPSKIIHDKSVDTESLKNAYLSIGKEMAVTQYIFDLSAQKLSVKGILLLAEILFNETTFRQKDIFILNVSGDRQKTPGPAMVYTEMEKLINWYNTAVKENDCHPIELASKLHYQLTTIHPFEDGNGRVARRL